jgi:nascent polypeptide-associated complex subunit alpha
MIPGMNPRDMQKAMKRLGIKQEEIEAETVIIKTIDKDLIINNPKVSKVNMMGQETFQITGEIIEQEKDNKVQINEDDIETVVSQTNCSKDDAREAIEQNNGNLAEAILKLQDK